MTLSHQSATNQQQPATIFVPKIPTTYECKLCDYVSCNKKDYNKHLITRKHKLATNSNSIYIEKTSYICENCNKEYQDRTGLWRHKKSCLNHRVQYTPSEMDKNNMNNITNEFQLDKELLIKMLLKNQDVMEKLAEVVPMMIELMPKIGNQSNNNNDNSRNIRSYHTKWTNKNINKYDN
jgi:hypothetical protein